MSCNVPKLKYVGFNSQNLNLSLRHFSRHFKDKHFVKCWEDKVMNTWNRDIKGTKWWFILAWSEDLQCIVEPGL